MKKRLLNLMKLRTAVMLAAVVVTFLGLPTKAWAQDPEWLQPGDTWSGYTLTVNSNLGYQAYYHLYDIGAVVISSNVTEIGEDAFKNCESLVNVTFEDDSKLETIGKSAFWYCRQLEEIIIPASVKTINDEAFEDCRMLETIQFEAGSQLETIGKRVFNHCTSLTSITVSSSTPPVLGTNAFNNTPCDILVIYSSLAAYRQADGWSDYATRIKAIESTIPTTSGTCGKTSGDNVTWTMTDADNDGIYETLTIGGSGGDMADYSSTSPAPWKDHSAYITCVVIEENVTNVSDESFADCTNLTAVNKVVDGVLMSKDGTKLVSYPADKAGDSYILPATVTSIADGAFSDNFNLLSLYVMQDTPPTLGAGVFPEVLTICVVGTNLAAYQAAWSDYSERIKGLYTITTGEGVNSNAAERVEISYNSKNYYRSGSEIQLLPGDKPVGSGDFIGFNVTNADGVDITSTDGLLTKREYEDGYILVTPESDITVTALWQELGGLKVTNTVVSSVPADANMNFEFTVTLSNTTINGEFSGVTFTDGVATITLKGGEQKTVTGIPTSLDYTVTQTAVEGFETTKDGDEGSISSTLSTAAFVNTKTYMLTGLVFVDGMHYATYCNTTDKDLTVPVGLKAYAVTGVNEDEDVVTLAEVGFLPKRDGTSFVALLMYRADLNTSVGVAYDYTGTETVPTTNLRYNLDEKGADDGDFVLYNDEFVKAKGTIPGGTRYLSMGGYAASRLGIGGEATGIFSNGLTRTDSDHDRWYDLQGRRIEKPTKPGLYIRNGQKQVIKTMN